MKSLFIDIRKKIMNDAMFSDLHIDENYGQLDSETDFYEVDFPCILLDITQTEWDNLVHGTQVGTCSVKVSLAIDCKDEELGNSIDERIEKRETYFKRMHRLLHNFSAGKHTPLIRKSFQTRSLPGSIKVYECTYICTVKESIAPLDTIKPSSIIIDPEIETPRKFVLPDLEDMD